MRRWFALVGAVVAIAVATWLLTREPASNAPPPPAPVAPSVVAFDASFAVAVTAVVDAGEEEDDDYRTLRLAGVVVDRGQPVEGASVTTPDTKEEVTALTDAAGHFELVVKVLSGNEDVMELSAEARKDDRFGAISFRTAVDKLDLRIELDATATLRVSLRDPDGVPIRGGSVDAVGDIGTTSNGGDGPPQVDFSAESDGRGDAVLQVRPDTYWITGSWADGETEQRTGVKVALGHETHVTLKFRRYSLKGHVLNRAGEGVVDARLELHQHGARVRGAEDDDELSGDHGAFSYSGLAPGAYELYASDAREGSGHATLHVPDLDAKVFVESANDISGRVEDERGAPQPLFVVTARSGKYEVDTRAGEDGTFRLSCPPGTYEVTALASRDDGDDRRGTATVTLAPHGHERITVVVPAAKPILGQVVDTDGAPVAKVTVSAKTPGARRANAEDFSGPDGHFHFASLSQAEYSLEVGGPWTVVDKETVHPGDPPVKLVVEHRPEVHGRAVDPAGAPLKHFFVNGQAFDASDGHFAVESWRDRKMSLYLDGDAAGEGVYAVTPKAHGVTEAGDLAVSPLQMVVTVLDAKRRPLSHTSFNFQLDGGQAALFMGENRRHYFMKETGDDGRIVFPLFFSDGFSVSAWTRASGKIDRVIVPKATALELVTP